MEYLKATKAIIRLSAVKSFWLTEYITYIQDNNKFDTLYT